MRIRRRTTDALPHARTPSSSRPRSPPAAAPSPPSPASARRSGTAVPQARRMDPPALEVDPTMCKAAPLDPRRPSRGGNRQEEQEEESDKATVDEKRGEEDGRSEQELVSPVHVVCSTRAAPKREEEERRTGAEEEEEEKKSEDSAVRVKDEEKAAAMCKKGDGKGWHCKRVAQCGYSLCQYHLDKLRSYGCYSQKKTTAKQKPSKASAPVSQKPTAAAIHRQGASQQTTKKKRRRRMEEHALGTGSGVSDSFYYYSGFGPRWRRRRGDRSVDGAEVVDSGAAQALLHQDMAAAAAAGEEEEGEYDCDSAGGDGRPLKSRALSSLL